jgi:hypothetical protein
MLPVFQEIPPRFRRIRVLTAPVTKRLEPDRTDIRTELRGQLITGGISFALQAGYFRYFLGMYFFASSFVSKKISIIRSLKESRSSSLSRPLA